MKKIIHVVAAIIEDNSRILIAQRKDGEFSGLWEFPGGKYEKGETGEEAITREIKEEFNADICVKDFLCAIEHEYDNFILNMDCYICEFLTNKIELHDHTGIRWIDPHEKGVDWVPADKKVIKAYKGKK